MKGILLPRLRDQNDKRRAQGDKREDQDDNTARVFHHRAKRASSLQSELAQFPGKYPRRDPELLGGESAVPPHLFEDTRNFRPLDGLHGSFGGFRKGSGKAARRKNRSERKRPCSTASRKRALVAATIRASTEIVCVPPRRSKTFSSIRRRSFAWVGRGSSPISSRKSVPWFANSTLPA